MSTTLVELPGATWRTVHRVVLPVDADADDLALYVDYDSAVSTPGAVGGGRPGDDADSLGAAPAAAESGPSALAVRTEGRAENVRGRRGLVVDARTRVSFGTYFNAFPASYWRRWTTASAVRLRVELAAPGTVTVYRSNARGLRQRVSAGTVAPGQPLVADLSLAAFGDGGWYWFDVAAGAADTALVSAEWQVAEEVPPPASTLSIAVTTYNRPDYCLELLRTLAAAEDVRAVLDHVYVMDQGTQLVADEPGFAEVAAALGDQLRIVRQGNLGGSGGFSRGMRETLRAGVSDHVLLLDDDIVLEPEGVLRALQFAQACRTPTVVGGHMFDMFDRSVMHSFGERIDKYRFFWGSVPGVQERHDLSAQNLRATPWMHKRVDVDYNGWWMCLIPLAVLREVGLSLPVFIKWDDAEFGLRAGEAGFPTVSLPGAAVWHVSWTDKDDGTDWQAYFHERNRLVAALLHSPYPRGGRIFRESVFTDVKHLFSMQYSTEVLRLMALQDVLSGPEHLLATLPTRTAEVRQARKAYPDARTSTDVDAFPRAHQRKPPRKGKEPTSPNRYTLLPWAAAVVARHLTAPAPEALERPEKQVAAMDSTWWRLAHYDSAVVSTADGTAAAWYKRDPREFRRLLARSAEAHRQLWARWDELAAAYREAMPRFTSPQAWDGVFEVSTVPVPQAQPAAGGNAGEVAGRAAGEAALSGAGEER